MLLVYVYRSYTPLDMCSCVLQGQLGCDLNKHAVCHSLNPPIVLPLTTGRVCAVRSPEGLWCVHHPRRRGQYQMMFSIGLYTCMCVSVCPLLTSPSPGVAMKCSSLYHKYKRSYILELGRFVSKISQLWRFSRSTGTLRLWLSSVAKEAVRVAAGCRHRQLDECLELT